MVSTAKMIEESGYMPKTSSTENASREKNIAEKLSDPKICIEYVAAYLQYFQDRWKEAYPNIDGKTDILATLFNQGEQNPPHSSPRPNGFGEFAKLNYYYMQELLDIQ